MGKHSDQQGNDVYTRFYGEHKDCRIYEIAQQVCPICLRLRIFCICLKTSCALYDHLKTNQTAQCADKYTDCDLFSFDRKCKPTDCTSYIMRKQSHKSRNLTETAVRYRAIHLTHCRRIRQAHMPVPSLHSCVLPVSPLSYYFVPKIRSPASPSPGTI